MGMKDSGIQWIDGIPKEWDNCRIKDVISVLTDYTANGSFQSLADNVEYLDYEDYARVIRLTDLRVDMKNCGIYVTEEAYNYLAKSSLYGGEILVANVGAYAGYFCEMPVVDYPATLGPNMFLIKTNKKLISRFLYYIGNSNYANEQLILKSTSSAQPKLNKQDVKTIYIAIPRDQKEQQEIADFLDDKVGKIDDILTDLNNQVDILQKYKKSLITETVTKGLNPDVKMKDSGIEWIGEIPENWEIKPLKYLGTARNGLTYAPENQTDDGILVMRSSNIQNGELFFEDNVYVDMKIPPNLILKENDLLICSRNGSRNLVGKNALIDKAKEGQTYGAFMCVYRSQYNKFIHYVLNSDIFSYYLSSFLTSTINQLTNANLYSIKTPFPTNLEEQQEIVKFLDKKCAQIEEIIKDKQTQIEKMESYKKSLIYEYVTGKKRVKGAEI